MPNRNRDLFPVAPDPDGFNPKAKIPFGVNTRHVLAAMREFTGFLQLVDGSLIGKNIPRLEDMLMPANFSSIVGEFMASSIPKYCKTVVKNKYHNGHPDMLPAGKYKDDMAQHAGADGIEVKGSRYLRGWQGHNAEDAWLMVFMFESSRPADKGKGIPPKAFRFLMVAGALLSRGDWQFAGRKADSRRTITASVTRTGYEKMMANWIYMCGSLRERKNVLVISNTEK